MELSSVLRRVGLTAAFVVLIYLAVGALIRLHYPEDDTAPIDTLASSATLVDDAPQIVLYEVDRLRKPAGKRLVVVGSSNAMMTLLPADLHRELPAWEVHNLSIPTSNVHETRQVVDLVLAASDRETLSRTVIVIGLYYGLFATGEGLWRHDRGQPLRSPLSVEMLRYGVYRESAVDSPRPLLGERQVALTKDLYRVLLGVDTLARGAESLVDGLVAGKRVDLGVFAATLRRPYQWRSAPSDAANQRKENEKRASQIGTPDRIPDAQFALLEELVRRITAAGARVILTELPTPTWNRLAHFQFYRAQKQGFVRALGQLPGAGYLDLYDELPDDEMGDSSHPLKQGAHHYAKSFVQAARDLPGFVDLRDAQ